MTQRRRTPAPGDPSTYPATQHELSRVDLRLGIDLDAPSSEEREAETGPVPVVASRPPASDGLKIGVGSAGVFAFLALVDKALSGTGLTAADVVEHLGPALGVFYQSSPIVACVIVVGLLLARVYRRDQDTHRRRDRRLQQAFVAFGHAIKTEISGLRNDVNGFTTALDRVRTDVEAKIVAEVTAAAREATGRADRTDQAIADLRAGHTQLEARVSRVEALPPPVSSAVARRPAVASVPPALAPHAGLPAVPHPTRRAGRSGSRG